MYHCVHGTNNKGEEEEKKQINCVTIYCCRMPPFRSDRRSKRIQKRTQSEVDNINVNSQESHTDIDTPNNVDSNIWTVVGRFTNSLTAVQQQLSALQHQQAQNTTIQQADVSQTLNDAQNLNIEGIQDYSGNCRTQLGTDLNSSGLFI